MHALAFVCIVVYLLCVRVNACMYAGMCVRVHVYIFARVYACIYICVCVCIVFWVCVCECVYRVLGFRYRVLGHVHWACMCMYACVRLCKHVCMCVSCVCVCIRTHTHMHAHTMSFCPPKPCAKITTGGFGPRALLGMTTQV